MNRPIPELSNLESTSICYRLYDHNAIFIKYVDSSTSLSHRVNPSTTMMVRVHDHLAEQQLQELRTRCDNRTCTVCGLDKSKGDFPRFPLRRTPQPCLVCSFMTKNDVAQLTCSGCGLLKPIVAFSRQKRSTRKCRPCMKRSFCDSGELV